MMTIVYILEYFHPHFGGIETLFAGLIDRLADKGYRAIVVTSLHDSSLLREEHFVWGTVYRIPGTRKTFFLTGLWFIFTNRDRFRESHCIVTSTFVAGFVGYIAGIFLGLPVLLTVHEVFRSLWQIVVPGLWGWIYRFLERILCRLPFAGFSCVSHATCASLLISNPHPSGDLRVIYNAVDYDARHRDIFSSDLIHQTKYIYGWERKIVYLYAGHCGGSKGIDVLISAWEIFVSDHPNCILVCNLLPSRNRDDILARINQSSFKESFCVFLGMTKRELLAKVLASDCVVIPSRSEGFGIFCAEVSALEIPLIVTRTGSLPEVASGSVWWCEPDNCNDMVRALKAHYLFHTQSDFASSPSYIAPKRFERNQTVNKFECFIKDIIAN